MAKERWKLTDAQWQKIEPLLPKPKKSKKGGRPWANNGKKPKKKISPQSSNGRTESFEKTLFKVADRKYRKNKRQFE